MSVTEVTKADKIFINRREIVGAEYESIVFEGVPIRELSPEGLAQAQRDITLYGGAYIEVPEPEQALVEAPKKTEVIVEEKCEVCGRFIEINYYHSSCYTVKTGPLSIEYQDDVAEFR